MSLDVTLVCDGPGMPDGPAPHHEAWVNDGAPTPRTARRRADELHGWVRFRGRDLCPRCASKHLPRR